MNHRRGFTLIEILVSVSLSLILVGAAVTAFVQLRKMTQRVTVRMDLITRAETLFNQFNPRLTTVLQHAAFIIDTQPTSPAGAAIPTLRLVYMRGKESQNDWEQTENTFKDNSDTYWEMWEYRPDERRLYQANSRRAWTFKVDLAPGNPAPPVLAPPVNLWGFEFINFPKARRTVNPAAWWSTLDDNQLFPSMPRATPPAVPRSTPVCPPIVSANDHGDWGMLWRDLTPVGEGLTDLSLQVVSQDGTIRTFAAGAPATTWVAEGAWMDGRILDAGGRSADTAGFVYGTTCLAQRPVLLRMRFTLADPSSGISQIFTFSFQLPSVTGK